jgi:hypothetical protein
MKTYLPIGACAYLDGLHRVYIVGVFPEGSASYLFSHYKVRDGREIKAVTMGRIGVEKKMASEDETA